MPKNPKTKREIIRESGKIMEDAVSEALEELGGESRLEIHIGYATIISLLVAAFLGVVTLIYPEYQILGLFALGILASNLVPSMAIKIAGIIFTFVYIGIIFFNSFWIDNLIFNALFSYILAFAAAAALAVFFDFAAYKPLRKRDATPLMLMIASLGISIIIRGVVQFIWGPRVRKYAKPPQDIVDIGGASIYSSEIVVIIAVIAIFILKAPFF